MTLNDFIFVGFLLGTAVNYLVPQWEFKWREVIANFLVVLTAWIITEFFITLTPATLWGQVLYIALYGIAFSFSPLAVYRTVTSVGLNIIKKKIEAKSDETSR